mmetsp:Transcript_16885/g.49380  ORF Transcript_16885/g.49380 Transcript_16885/m.49380 type:complete len:580 (+) Transcript_16885:93-1832(+)
MLPSDSFYKQVSDGLTDVELALEPEPHAEDPSGPRRRRPCEADAEESEDGDGGASLIEARNVAREKFEWLTSHALVAQSRGNSLDRPISRFPGSDQVEDADGNGATPHRGPGPEAEPSPTAASWKMSRPGSYRSAAQYLQACARYKLTPNGGALLGLSLGLEMLEVDGTLTNLELVPLCAALLDAPFVQHLKLSGHPLQDTGAAVLALALPGCPWIRELELQDCRITGAGVRSICDALPKSGVWRLVLRGNLLRQNVSLANHALAIVVGAAARLTSLDLRSCGISSQGMRLIKRSLAERAVRGQPPCIVDFEGNFVLVEVLNSVTHGACALVCLEAWRRLNNLILRLCHFESRFAVLLYIVSMMLMFLGSTLYHSMFAVTDLSWFFRMIDHCAIYFLIAGTYTPVMVMGCRDLDTMKVQRGVALGVGIYWSLVAIGIAMEHVFAAPAKPVWYSKFILGMYVLLGFGGVPYISTCPLVHEGDVMGWIEMGGLTYVVGIVFFLLDKRYPAMHVVWHILVGLAAFFHFVGVWNLTTAVLKDPNRSCEGQSFWGNGEGAFADLLGWDSVSQTSTLAPVTTGAG